MSDPVARYIENPGEAPALLDALRPLHDEVGVVPIVEGKALHNIVWAIRHGTVIVVEEEGNIVASAGLVPADHWYGDGVFLADLWCWVRADRRDGKAAQVLLSEIAAFSDETDMHTLIVINNPNRRRLPKSRLEFMATALRYQPRGYVLTGGPV